MQFRYSTGSSEPTAFPWEFAVPVSPFWASFPWKDAACILKAFTKDEIQQFQLEEQYQSASDSHKYEIMLGLLEEKRVREEDRYANSHTTLQKADHQLWSRILLAIGLASTKLGRLERAEETHRDLIDGRIDPQDFAPINNFASFLIRNTTKYEEARALAIQSRDWLDKKLGRSSPQAIGVRKVIAETYWKEGNGDKVQETITEIFRCIDGLKDTKFAIYADSEREEALEWKESLGK